MIQSQMVTPPLAAMEGTTFKLKTATTKRRTRSRRPRARISLGAAGWAVVDKVVLAAAKSRFLARASPVLGMTRALASYNVLADVCRADRSVRPARFF
jgi:hypothetical protein